MRSHMIVLSIGIGHPSRMSCIGSRLFSNHRSERPGVMQDSPGELDPLLLLTVQLREE